MTFDLDTLSFPFLFLPAVLLCFTLAPQRCKNAVLVAASLIFYALGDLRFLPLMLCSLLLDYGVCAKLVRSTVQMKGRRLFFWGSIIKNILLMVVSMAGSQLGWFPMPLGLMVYTVTSMGYVIDVYNGDEYFDGSLIDFLLFTTFFGKLQAGPIVQYTELKEQWQHRELGLQRVRTGVKFYVGGLAKLVILAQGNAAVQQAIEQLPDASQTVLSTWVFIIVSTFSLYYTLTGYCDMARGLANLLGMDFPENFHYPFQSRTVSDFFNRFNITVTKFINRYVYIFLGADTNGVLSTIVNTLLTTMLMGVWFGLRLNYLVWGVYFAAFILLERYFLMRFLVRMPPIVDRIYTFVVVMFSFTIFSGGTLRMTGYYIRSMFGLNGLPFWNSDIYYILTTNYLVILLSFFFATSLTGLLGKTVRSRWPKLLDALGLAVYLDIYVAADSADAWAGGSLFETDAEGSPRRVAGCPPDYFAKDGQLWGNPLYDWAHHRATGYAWWVRRVRHALALYGEIRIDHFRAFDTYYAIPAGASTARDGVWEQGPGMELFEALRRELGQVPIVAEDLGLLFGSVRRLLKASGLPGMKVLQFAFDPDCDSEYLPHNHPENCVVYPGTHDNATAAQWLATAGKKELAKARAYLGLTKEEGEVKGFLRGALASPARLAVIPAADWLGLGAEGRINTPGTSAGNWQWRAKPGAFSPALAGAIRRQCAVYGRGPAAE